MQFNLAPKRGDLVRVRINGVVVDAKYYSMAPCGRKAHWVETDDEVFLVPCGTDRFVYPIEQMENYKAKVQ